MREYIYGKNTVMEAIKSNNSLVTVYILNNQKQGKIEAVCKQKRIKYEYVDKKFFQENLGNVVHQGLMGLVEEFKYYSVLEIVEAIPKHKQPLLVMLDGLEDPHNLGAILRTCDAVGVDGVIIPKNRSVSLTSTVAKVSTGAIDHIKVAQVTNLTNTIAELKELGYWIIGVDNTESQDYRTIDYNMPIVIVMGSEGKGISRLVKKNCDLRAVIPMVGHVTSLNVSNATAVILYEVFNSRFPK